MIALLLSIAACVISLLTAIFAYRKIEMLVLNLYNLSKGMDVLFANQDKILELTKIKGFVELVNEEERVVKQEIIKEKTRGKEGKKSV